MKNAAKNPTVSSAKGTVESATSPDKISLIIFPKINGTTIKKENRAAFSRSIPSKTEVPIVAPDLETPGRIAIACDIPIIIEWKKLTSFVVFLVLYVD